MKNDYENCGPPSTIHFVETSISMLHDVPWIESQEPNVSVHIGKNRVD